MKVIAIANYKGGVAKTTTACNLSAGLARKGHRVLVIDNDPQSNLTGCFMNARAAAQLRASIHDAMVAKIPGAVPLPIVNVRPGLDLVPSTLKHSGTETAISGRADAAEILKRIIDPLREKYDFIIIDCPPTPSHLNINALVAADRVIVPVELQALPVKGIQQITQMVEIVRSNLNPSLLLGGIVCTRYKSNNLAKVNEGMLRQMYDVVFETKINESVQIAMAPAFGRTIFEQAPDSKAAKQFEALVEEMELMK